MPRTKKTEAVFDYEKVAPIVQEIMRKLLGEDALIKTKSNIHGQVQMDVVSSRLNCMTEREKQDFLWNALENALGEKTNHVSIVLGYGTNESYPDMEAISAAIHKFVSSPAPTSNGQHDATTTKFNFTQFAPRVKAGLRKAFPEDTIVIKEGYQGRIHVKIVSERFNGMTERDKQNYIWDVLHTELEPEAQQAVSVAVAYATDEL